MGIGCCFNSRIFATLARLENGAVGSLPLQRHMACIGGPSGSWGEKSACRILGNYAGEKWRLASNSPKRLFAKQGVQPRGGATAAQSCFNSNEKFMRSKKIWPCSTCNWPNLARQTLAPRGNHNDDRPPNALRPHLLRRILPRGRQAPRNVIGRFSPRFRAFSKLPKQAEYSLSPKLQ